MVAQDKVVSIEKTISLLGKLSITKHFYTRIVYINSQIKNAHTTGILKRQNYLTNHAKLYFWLIAPQTFWQWGQPSHICASSLCLATEIPTPWITFSFGLLTNNVHLFVRSRLYTTNKSGAKDKKTYHVESGLLLARPLKITHQIGLKKSLAFGRSFFFCSSKTQTGKLSSGNRCVKPKDRAWLF